MTSSLSFSAPPPLRSADPPSAEPGCWRPCPSILYPLLPPMSVCDGCGDCCGPVAHPDARRPDLLGRVPPLQGAAGVSERGAVPRQPPTRRRDAILHPPWRAASEGE